jgi:hypothetical protein
MQNLNIDASTISKVNPALGLFLSNTGVVEDDHKKDTFGAKSSSGTTYGIIHYILLFIALYMVYKCKDKPEFNVFLNALGACCCTPCYIVYRLVVPC